MINFLKGVRLIFWGTLTIMLVATLVVVSVWKNSQKAPPMKLGELTKVTSYYSTDYQKAIRKSRESSVRIVSSSPKFLGLSSSSGTYFESKGKYYVITTQHGILGSCSSLSATHEGVFYQCEKIAVADENIDYAIVEIEGPILDRTPIRIPRDLATQEQQTRSYSILSPVIYTGYPNTIGPLTLRGNVIGYGGTDYLYMFSYAYAGSSGSGIFGENGKYVGYVIALDVGVTEYGIDILENMVLVVPAFKIDWNALADSTN